jgi:hypothetical protein
MHSLYHMETTEVAQAHGACTHPIPRPLRCCRPANRTQASTNVLLAHFMSIVFTNLMLGALNRLGSASTA